MEILWRGEKAGSAIECVLDRGCGGVEVQVWVAGALARRERHADRSTAYERARDLRGSFEAQGFVMAPRGRA